MSRELNLKEARAVIKNEDVNVLIKQIETASNRTFTESETELFKLAYRHGFAGGLDYGKETLLDSINN